MHIKLGAKVSLPCRNIFRPNKMSIYFGLHVGQSSACLAVHRDGRLDVVANDAGDRTTPACVGINEGEILVGASAKQLGGRKPASVIKHNMSILSLNDKAVSCFKHNDQLNYLPW